MAYCNLIVNIEVHFWKRREAQPLHPLFKKPYSEQVLSNRGTLSFRETDAGDTTDMASPTETYSGLDKEEEESFSYAMQLTTSSVLPMAIQTVFELGIFDVIANTGADAKLSAEDIAAKLPTKNPDASVSIDRILRLLVSHSVLACSLDSDAEGIQTRLYSLLPVSKFFVRNDDGVSLWLPLLALANNKAYFDSWREVKEAILEGGIAFNRVHGMHLYEYPRTDPKFGRVFQIGMISHTTILMKKVVETYKGFEQLKQLIDVGGGLGVTLSIITSKYPHIRGINFDLPVVIADAPSYPGVVHVAGDMFESVPQGEALFIKWILHNWSDDYCLRLLKNCHKALPSDGKLIVMETVVPVMPGNSAANRDTANRDVFMMLAHGGKERTQQEFMTLATEAGFSGVRFPCYVCNFWVMEFYK